LAELEQQLQVSAAGLLEANSFIEVCTLSGCIFEACDCVSVLLHCAQALQASSAGLRADRDAARSAEARAVADAAELRDRLADLQSRFDALAMGRDRALETALSGSIRLCIVAPTVNVHVADKKLTFRAKCVSCWMLRCI
jgi:outer membrane murein-binding lipoprotein Lpp